MVTIVIQFGNWQILIENALHSFLQCVYQRHPWNFEPPSWYKHIHIQGSHRKLVFFISHCFISKANCSSGLCINLTYLYCTTDYNTQGINICTELRAGDRFRFKIIEELLLTHLCPRKDYWADFYNFLHVHPSDDQMKISSKSEKFDFFTLCRYIFVPPGINGLIL